MQTTDIRVMIMIPVYNAVDVIDRTIQSIRNQSYDAEKIFTYVVDFGSTDGTYEKLLDYDSYHLAIFQMKNKRIERTMPADVASAVFLQQAGGTWSYELLLEPGDELYRDFLKKNIALYYPNRFYNPSRLWCEVDIRQADGSIHHPVPLFDAPCIVTALDNCTEFIEQGCVHEMLVFGKSVSVEKGRDMCYENEGRYWSKGLTLGIESNSVYNPEVLACRAEKKFKDEMEEILLRWERIIFFKRGYEAKYKRGIADSIIGKAEKGVAYYALWRCCKNITRLPELELMNCYDIAAVICPEIRTDQLYQEFLNAKEKLDMEKIKHIELQIENVKTKPALQNTKLVMNYDK